MDINLKYFHKYANAGDQFSKVVAQHYFSPRIIPCDNRQLTEPNLLLVGSILEWSDAMSHVCGTGLIVSESKLRFRPRYVNCVRGPLTAYFLRKQGIKVPCLFGDPGILARRFFHERTSPDIKVGVVPHYKDSASPWINYCRQLGVFVIDALAPLDEYFHNLQRCQTILSSSLHGIIFAHAYGKPALWIELSDRVIGNGFKFFDYYLSIGCSPERVTRLRITDNVDPYQSAKFATVGDHADLLPALDEAIRKTRSQLQDVC
jgi:pyruvyltransferase